MPSYFRQSTVCGLCQNPQLQSFRCGSIWVEPSFCLDGHPVESGYALWTLDLSACVHCPYVTGNLARRPGIKERRFFLKSKDLPPLERVAEWALTQEDFSTAWRAFRGAAWEAEHRLEALRVSRWAAIDHADGPSEKEARARMHRMRRRAAEALRPLLNVRRSWVNISQDLVSHTLAEPEPLPLQRLRSFAFLAVAHTELVRRLGDWTLASECQADLELAIRSIAAPAAMAAAMHPAQLSLTATDHALVRAVALDGTTRQRIDAWLLLRDALNLQRRLLLERARQPATEADALAASPDLQERRAAEAALEALQAAQKQAQQAIAKQSVSPQAWVKVLADWSKKQKTLQNPKSQAEHRWLEGARRVLRYPVSGARLVERHPIDDALGAENAKQAVNAWRKLPMPGHMITILNACVEHYAWPAADLLQALALALVPVLSPIAADLQHFAASAQAKGRTPPPELVDYLRRALSRSTLESWHYAAPSMINNPGNAPPSFKPLKGPSSPS